jgi:hypothetical protein
MAQIPASAPSALTSAVATASPPPVPEAAAAMLELALPPPQVVHVAVSLCDGVGAPSEPPVPPFAGVCLSLAYMRDCAHAALSGTCGERAGEAGKVRRQASLLVPSCSPTGKWPYTFSEMYMSRCV